MDDPAVGGIDAVQDDAINTAIQAFTNSWNRRVGKEILAAWMAGYNVLDVVVDPSWPTPTDADLLETMTIKAAFIPSQRPHEYPTEVNVDRYDLSDLTRVEADQIRDRVEGDDG